MWILGDIVQSVTGRKSNSLARPLQTGVPRHITWAGDTSSSAIAEARCPIKKVSTCLLSTWNSSTFHLLLTPSLTFQSGLAWSAAPCLGSITFLRSPGCSAHVPSAFPSISEGCLLQTCDSAFQPWRPSRLHSGKAKGLMINAPQSTRQSLVSRELLYMPSFLTS